MKTTVTMPSNKAAYLADLLAYRVESVTICLDADELAILGALHYEVDGHFDGEHIWLGGSEYPVVTE